MSKEIEHKQNRRPFRELSLVSISPLFISLFGIPFYQYFELVVRQGIHHDLPMGLLVSIIGVIAGITISYLGIHWLIAMMFKQKSSYNVLYHIIFLLLPIIFIMFYLVFCFYLATFYVYQSILMLALWAISGSSFGLASFTTICLLVTYLRVRQMNQHLVWFYFRGKTRLSGLVELYRVPNSN